jgi:glycosyltransferase involved in cell wall biosynthesis
MISCKMITYGRVDFLEESLYSFLIQDYNKEKELVIVNDYPLQKLVFNHPNVRIINLDNTFECLGEKENFATSQCRGEIIAQWDDDDMALPNHLSNIDKYFVEGSDLLHWHNAIMMNAPEIQGLCGVGNSGIVYSKSIWHKIGGYPMENAGYDMSFVLSIKHASNNIVFAHPKDEEVSWIYVWGGRGYHCSGMGTDTPDRPNVVQRHSEYIENLRKQGKIPTGEILLNPHWKHNYSQKLKSYINAR